LRWCETYLGIDDIFEVEVVFDLLEQSLFTSDLLAQLGDRLHGCVELVLRCNREVDEVVEALGDGVVPLPLPSAWRTRGLPER
jgi:hypothetical protein